MSVLLRSCPSRSLNAVRGLGLAAVSAASAALALAGCSADITRFDNPSFALGESAGGTATRRTAGGPVIERPAGGLGDPPTIYSAPPRPRATDVAALPGVDDAAEPRANVPPVRALAVTRAPATQAQPAPAAAARGQQIEVQQGDTLYAISKRHGVMISDLMAVNELKNPNLKPGQKLYLPSAGGRATPQIKPERTVAVAKSPAQPAAPAAPAATGGDSYTVKPGDSLYAIAARHKVKLLDLQRANDITDVSKVKPGTVLKLPSGSGQAQPAVAATSAGEPVQPEARIVRVAAPASGAATTAGLKVLNGDGQAAAAAPSASPAAAPASRVAAVGSPALVTTTDATSAPVTGPGAKLRWPAKGRVVQPFGPRADGSHNDGLDISVPAGTDVLAAEGGVVAYAGSEVKTYGNLVLLRHDNGWVTAYAYNEKLLVQRGDRVKRGQPIAKAGKSGAADQPQVHFEVRVGSKPVDPSGYLEKQ